MYVERLSLMEKTHSFFINHFHRKIFNPINNVNIILVCLRTIHHEPFENKHTQPFFLNNYVQLPPENALNFHVFRLHVTDCNRHHLTIDWVVNVTSHGHPSLNMFFLDRTSSMQIIIRLHLRN